MCRVGEPVDSLFYPNVESHALWALSSLMILDRFTLSGVSFIFQIFLFRVYEKSSVLLTELF